MIIDRLFRALLPVTCLFFVTACGGGGSGSSGPVAGPNPPPPPPPPPVSAPTSVNLSSDAGDYIGAGNNYSYTNADALITVTSSNARLTISVEGDESWRGEFQLPNTYTELQPGSYSNLTRYPFHDAAVGGMDWDGEGRGCNTLTGWIIIDKVTYAGTTLTEIELQFEQHCEGGAPALRGDIRWDANDTTSPPGPVVPPPAGLWEPAPGMTPANGNFVYLESEPGDYIGAGGSYTYTPADSVTIVNATDGRLSVSVNGNERWNGDFQAMNSVSQLAVGYYGDLQRYPFHSPVKGGLNWGGEGRGCNRLTGWFVVDSVTYDGMTLTTIDLRFEQHCEGGAPALRGEIHWDVNDTTSPPGPVVPAPAGLWEPAPGITPATGNYVYLESEPGDFVGQGANYLYTQVDSVIDVDTSDARLEVSIDGNENWNADFQAMNTLNRLEVGYYGDLQRYPFHNPATGGLSWGGEGRGCNNLTGWFVVDSLTYAGMTLMAVDLRFEQFCDGRASALHGEIHWDVNDTTSPAGPVVPAPAGLWEPAPGITPATGNYVYLESQRLGEAVVDYTYTQADSVIRVETFDANLNVFIQGDEDWTGDFQAMNVLSQLEVGYYGDLQRFPFHNPTIGGLRWLGCANSVGWVVIDSLTYVGTTLTAIDMRIEQICPDATFVLRGEVHWDVNDTTSPPGPVVPPPAGLWEPAAGTTPATGNYVYLESEQGDYIGRGENYLYTSADSQITINGTNANLSVAIDENERWNGDFQAMNTLGQLEVGFYGDLQRYPFHNPTKGGLSWFGNGRGCNRVTGWFVVDSATYDGTTLTAIDLRFEQNCEFRIVALHGEIHWSQ